MSPELPDRTTATTTAGRLFTPALANKTLPLVRCIVADILEKAAELRVRNDEATSPERDAAVDETQQEVLALMEELENLGCRFKDWNFEVGLVDFPARIHGREVLLCWRSDEERVTHYHSPEDGYPGRVPIPAELLEDEEPSEN